MLLLKNDFQRKGLDRCLVRETWCEIDICICNLPWKDTINLVQIASNIQQLIYLCSLIQNNSKKASANFCTTHIAKYSLII